MENIEDIPQNSAWVYLAILTAVFVTIEILGSRIFFSRNRFLPNNSIDLVTFAVLARFFSFVTCACVGSIMYAAMNTKRIKAKFPRVRTYIDNQMERQHNFKTWGYRRGAVWGYILLSAFAMGMVILLYATAQQFAPHTSFPPAIQSSVVSIVVLFAGYFILKEKNIEKSQIAGVFVAGLGIFLILFKKETLKKIIKRKSSTILDPVIPMTDG